MAPEYVPAPAMIRSFSIMSAAMRMRCCMSATSGCVRDVLWDGSTSANTAPMTTSMIVVETSISTSVKPALRGDRRRVLALIAPSSS